MPADGIASNVYKMSSAIPSAALQQAKNVVGQLPMGQLASAPLDMMDGLIKTGAPIAAGVDGMMQAIPGVSVLNGFLTPFADAVSNAASAIGLGNGNGSPGSANQPRQGPQSNNPFGAFGNILNPGAWTQGASNAFGQAANGLAGAGSQAANWAGQATNGLTNTGQQLAGQAGSSLGFGGAPGNNPLSAAGSFLNPSTWAQGASSALGQAANAGSQFGQQAANLAGQVANGLAGAGQQGANLADQAASGVLDAGRQFGQQSSGAVQGAANLG